ncbi:J domain-containing protein [Spirulina sp. 06S082]|uniref:J domain-containing protein n=1 Tax=Spirulina sp. 06S082 TaxID=3110248 RepID=UPI002B20CDBE|nr:J domain-containing protein [Spirulina sp. 06S082]MEA5468596.1 J domain-containing protein [Spirulina sp. 06S082]
MSQSGFNPRTSDRRVSAQARIANSYYARLGLHPSASVIEIRRSYWRLSKRYHPDTTTLPPEIATVKFQKLNEAYAILSDREGRLLYDSQIGYSRFYVVQPRSHFSWQEEEEEEYSNTAYLDPSDRPLSGGELFALFILGVTFLSCILLAIAVGLTRGETALQIPVALLSFLYSNSSF